MLPVSGAKGRNAFTATSSVAPQLPHNDDMDPVGEERLSGGVAMMGGDGNGVAGVASSAVRDVAGPSIEHAPVSAGEGSKGSAGGDWMDVDTTIGSLSAGKRKHADDAENPSQPPTPLASTSRIPSAPRSGSAKKQRSAKVKSSASGVTSSGAAMKITPAVAIHNMQGTINRLTDVIQQTLSAPQDPAALQRNDAIVQLQTREDGLTLDQKMLMIQKFTSDAAIAGAYLALSDDELRRGWMQHLLAAETNAR